MQLFGYATRGLHRLRTGASYVQLFIHSDTERGEFSICVRTLSQTGQIQASALIGKHLRLIKVVKTVMVNNPIF